MKKPSKEQISKDWQVLNKTKNSLEAAINEASVGFKTLPDCLILAQKINNLYDFIELEYGIPNKLISKKEFTDSKAERDQLYKKLYEIFDKLTNDKMVGYIKDSLDDRVMKYEMYVQNIDDSTNEDIIMMLELRDEIKYLYDELDIWTGRWSKREERVETCDIRDKFCQEIGGHDVLLRKYLVDNMDKFSFLKGDAKKHMIIKPDGSKRFDFWWWYIIE